MGSESSAVCIRREESKQRITKALRNGLLYAHNSVREVETRLDLESLWRDIPRSEEINLLECLEMEAKDLALAAAGLASWLRAGGEE